MGTRNLTIVKHDGKYKLAQYGQWDGYPSGQGKTALEFLRNIDKEKFLKNLNALTELTEESRKEVAEKLGDDWKEKHPELTRDTGAEILQLIQDGKVTYFDNDIDFIKDSLFCEWAYVIDFDTNTFEVFKGFSETKLTEEARFFEKQKEIKPSADGTMYYPCGVLASFELDKLPTEEEFLKLEKEEED